MRDANLVVRLPQYDCDMLKREAAAKNITQGRVFSELFREIARDPYSELPKLVHRRLMSGIKDVKGGEAIGLYMGADLYDKFREISDKSGIPRSVLAKIIIEDALLAHKASPTVE